MGKNKEVFKGEVSGTITSQPLFQMQLIRPGQVRMLYHFSVKLDEKIGNLPEEIGVNAPLKSTVVLRTGDKVRMKAVIFETPLKSWNTSDYRLSTEDVINDTLQMGSIS